MRTTNTAGMVVCALITTLLLTVRHDEVATWSRDAFERTMRTRLDRARAAAADDLWSLLDIRLDDSDDTRTASSTAEFNASSPQKFARDVDGVLPADADLEQVASTLCLAFVPHSQSGVRELPVPADLGKTEPPRHSCHLDPPSCSTGPRHSSTTGRCRSD